MLKPYVLRKNVASQTGGAVPLGCHLSSFGLARWSSDSASLVFADTLFEENVAEGSGGGAAHLTGTLAPQLLFRNHRKAINMSFLSQLLAT